ncbi:hypothetical protein CYMTET_24139 [Cymbomonas tetramitiformis]|uniref:NADH dehydrogenase [ubiquinone] 1 alpha subcomplex subunit 12 n=1 Tax=Cymbomonas tetramitiformis TaxID=36881 RepID=A0AAE0L0K1_9CHLO|nr:hypothetical protein CYMTET_24139 [Cymbomonas tetramitiformis]
MSVSKFANAPLTRYIAKDASKGGIINKIVDGNFFASHVLKSSPRTLVGTDDKGNQYYESMTSQLGRHRWVLYSDHDDYVDAPTGIPPEWHGWINHINDFTGPEMEATKPFYAIPATVTKTGTPDAYKPKGSWKHPAKRSWGKYTSFCGV